MKQPVSHQVGSERRRRWLWALGFVAALHGCASSDPRPGPLVFPGHNVGYGYSSLGSMVGVVGQDPAEAAAINPFDPIALNNLAVAEAARGRYQQASSLLQRAVKLAPARADIAANLSNLQRWLALAEGQAALGMPPQPLQLPYPEMGVPDLPPLWRTPGMPVAPTARGALPVVPPGSR
jgi:tetratricopeptide (TPR) repeat protein